MAFPKKNEKNEKPVATNSIEQLHVRLGEIAEECKVLQNIADNEKRALTADEVAKLDDYKREFDAVEKEVKTRAATNAMDDRLMALSQPNRRQTSDDVEVTNEEQRPRITGGLPAGSSKSTFGFRSLGEFAMGAFKTKNGKGDLRILNAPTTFGQEGINEDGGFAVPPDFRQNIMKQIMGEESLMSLCDQQSTTSNSLSLPLDTTTPWQTSGGVVPQWLGEGATIGPSKPRLGALETKLNKLAALVPVTEELMQDVTSLTSWLSSKVPEKFTSFLNDVIITGDGVAKPQGMLNSAAKVTVAAVAGQGAGTVVAKNIVDMYARSYGPLRRNGVWLINQDVEPLLQTLVMPGASPSFPAYLPPGGLSAAPYATLLGRPVIPIEACSAAGTEGDIMFVIPNQYLIVLKAGANGGMRTDVSMHLYFDSDHTAFKFVMRVGGQSYWPAPVARKNGSNTLSPIVTLSSTRT